MKTIAVRLDDEMAALLELVAELEGTTQIQQIRDAIAARLLQKAADVDLSRKAQKAVQEIDRIADVKKRTISKFLAGGSMTPRPH